MVYCNKKFLLLIFMMSILAVSCAPQKAFIDTAGMEKIFWPGPPEKPRIVYLWTVSSWYSGEQGGLADFFSGAPDLDVTDPQNSPKLLGPYGVFVDEEKQLYITDPAAYRVTIINTQTGEVRQILKAGEDDFVSPIGVVASRGNIFVSDAQLKKVFIFDAGGKLSGVFEGSLERPTGLAIDTVRGFIYVADTLAHCVYRYNLQGKRLGSIGKKGQGQGEFNFPTHIYVDNRGDLYVTDSMNFRLQFFSPEGVFAGMFGSLGNDHGKFEKPKGVAADNADHIYVVDSIKDTVKIFNREGQLLLFFGQQGRDYGQFYLPSGIFIKDDNIYVADTYNGRVQAFKYLGAK